MSERARWRRPARGRTNGVGIYDRDYYRQERSGFSLAVPRSAVVVLILVNVAVYLAEMFTEDQGSSLVAGLLAAHVSTLSRPWLWWQFITYGFVHDPTSPRHILLNMLALWVFGRDIEDWYGPKEFLRVYFALLVFGAVVWAVVNQLRGGLPPDRVSVVGASGAIAGIVILYAMNFPRRMFLFMFVLPMPAWLLGILMVAYDLLGATDVAEHSGVAFAVHLAGAGFAFVYFRQRWNFGRLLGGRFRFHWPRLRKRPPLHLHEPEEEGHDVPEETVDRILEKIHREGESSLTRKERQILETASREYQRRRQGEP